MDQARTFRALDAGIKQPRSQDYTQQKQNEFKTKTQEFDCTAQSETTCSVILDIVPEDGTGTDEEAADEDEGARGDDTIRYQMRNFDTDIEDTDKDKTGPDEREREQENEQRVTDLIRVMIPHHQIVGTN